MSVNAMEASLATPSNVDGESSVDNFPRIEPTTWVPCLLTSLKSPVSDRFIATFPTPLKAQFLPSRPESPAPTTWPAPVMFAS